MEGFNVFSLTVDLDHLIGYILRRLEEEGLESSYSAIALIIGYMEEFFDEEMES